MYIYNICIYIHIYTYTIMCIYPKHTSATVSCNPKTTTVGIPKDPLVWWQGKSILLFFHRTAAKGPFPAKTT